MLFVVMDFWNAGSERNMFEIHKYLKKSNVFINILSIRGLNMHDIFDDYYYSKHLELGGVDIKFLDDFKNKFNFLNKKINIFNLKSYLNSFNKIFFIGEYVFMHLENFLPLNFIIEKNIFVHTLRFQGDYYRNFNKHYKYNFIIGFDGESNIEYEFSNFDNYKTYFYPLSINFDLETDISIIQKEPENTFRIACFTRIAPDKPLELYFSALHLLINDNINVELHIFGTGDLFSSDYMRQIELLNVKSFVFFHGHSDNMLKSLKDKEINMIWYQSYNGFPSGFASIDLSYSLIPQVFWDFGNGEIASQNNLSVFPCFRSLFTFFQYSKKILFDSSLRMKLGQEQFYYFKKNNDIQNNFSVISKIIIFNESTI